MNINFQKRLGFIFYILILVAMSSCIGHKQLLILNEGKRFNSDSLAVFQNMPPVVIQSDDRLFIRVSAFDKELEERFNMPLGMMGQGGVGAVGGNMGMNPMLTNTQGTLVDNNGNVELPVIGTIQLGGLEIEAAKQKLYAKYGEYLVNYSVDLYFINKRVTVMGEVLMPGRVDMDRNRMTLLEAIQKAGGITPFSNTREVTIVREFNGDRSFATLNLKDRDIVNSPYFYIYPNDVIYLQPVKQKTFMAQTSFFSGISIFSSLVSAAAIIIAITR